VTRTDAPARRLVGSALLLVTEIIRNASITTGSIESGVIGEIMLFVACDMSYALLIGWSSVKLMFV